MPAISVRRTSRTVDAQVVAPTVLAPYVERFGHRDVRLSGLVPLDSPRNGPNS